ncbi:hypothetical protein AOL_s00140g2 [Orbilia oligospora ATCC 24927]|uniref:Uncharacterized protein n=1 Tax=Arthrobotrys oligospora (strain ATCC 24927 / CBS 115.81 / DSM 1491) TaxID=756982 RepID=G1XM33_ARTOA|nr:hypothetical protein AOL_s00140g2 [Orbilia oligospora ATCC 24927]EGX45686.1 hypothetical protein AOL_s00140g2 [Orbilia oligospora ATCC 24927]
MADPRIRALLGAAILEYVSDCSTFESVRQAIINFEEEADSKNGSGLEVSRAVSRRSTLEFVDIRSFNRITGRGTNPSIIYPNEALSTMTLGAGWAGTIYEIIALGFPECMPPYEACVLMEQTAAMMNFIASLPRDQRTNTQNALIPVWSEPGTDLAVDFKTLSDYSDNTRGPELSAIGQYSASHNNHSRYIMLAVFLAAARLGKTPLSGFRDIHLAKAIELAPKIQVPTNRLCTPHEDRMPRITSIITHLWEYIERSNDQKTDDCIASAQRALHRVIDEEIQGICWMRKDPAVLWAVCAALFWTMLNIDGMAAFLLQGDAFKFLEVESDGFEDSWLDEIYASKPVKPEL